LEIAGFGKSANRAKCRTLCGSKNDVMDFVSGYRPAAKKWLSRAVKFATRPSRL
jgi:hypothetical protein